MMTIYSEFEEEPPWEVAARFDCTVVYRESNQLQIDIDSEEATQIYQRRKMEMKELGWVFSESISPSKGGHPRYHITLTFEKAIGQWKAVALQLMFGSDPMRENMNALRIAAGIENPIRFFQPKKQHQQDFNTPPWDVEERHPKKKKGVKKNRRPDDDDNTGWPDDDDIPF